MNPEQKSLPQKERKIATSITKVHQSAGKEISIPMLNVWHQSLLATIHFEAPPH